jgi:hypothetical protein
MGGEIVLNKMRIAIGIMSLIGTGAAVAHSAAFEHAHTLFDSSAIGLCLIISVGVGVAIFQSSARAKRAIPIEVDQRCDRRR